MNAIEPMRVLNKLDFMTDYLENAKFYLTYYTKKNLTPLVAEIIWTHNIVILEKCKADLEREFNIKMTRKFGWTIFLINQIEN